MSDKHRPSSSPLRQKSPVAFTQYNTVNVVEDPLSARRQRQSNKEMREQYYRQINLCKKGALNFYETSTFVGFLLDMIYMTRKLEELKIKLIQGSDFFNLYDAWLLLEPRAYTGNNGRLSKIDFRDGLLRQLVKADKVTVDRLALLFNRYNSNRDDLMNFHDFQQMMLPINQHWS